jgi:hypothetical protein
MARDINKRLAQLKNRRQGFDRIGVLSAQDSQDILAKSFLTEAYQRRAPNQPNTRYALGAMQEVGPDYTKIGIEEAERVGKQLRAGLPSYGISVEFRLQGSVPANIHIRGVSDVDMLVLDTSFLVFARAGGKSLAGAYLTSSDTSLSVLQKLRSSSEAILKGAYPKADVDTSGGKAIKLSGGSLRRPVDVVPSHWYDNVEFQSSNDERDRGVYILDKKKTETIHNLPFKHIQRLNERDFVCREGLKKSIRLCKSVKADAQEDGTPISLPSFDIAATMWHADQAALAAGLLNELAILRETQRHLDALATNHAYAKSLLVPDGSRPIFDSNAKLNGLNDLSRELDDLALEVAKEQSLALRNTVSPSWAQVDRTLREAYIPAA